VTCQPIRGAAVTNMRRGRRVLRRIERDLAHSDLRLSMLFKSFTELAEDADMPGTEKMRTRRLRLFGRLASMLH